ncbi:MAG TPA: sigma-70 family RNA polymerase sigma factor, partial [Puia sp.]|nr:sigma-70 family RNA polymerase sigma factor [Puia sp.]
VVNTALSKARKNKTARHFDELESAEENAEDFDYAYQKLSSQDQSKYIGLAMERMNAEDKLLLTLYHLDEQSIEEISEITSISRDNVKMKLYRARKKIYSILNGMLKSELKMI